VKAKGGVTHITKKRTTANKLTKIIVNSDFVKKRFCSKTLVSIVQILLMVE